MTKACLKAVINASDPNGKTRFQVACVTSYPFTSADEFRQNMDKIGGIYAFRALQGHSVEFVQADRCGRSLTPPTPRTSTR